MGWVLQVLDEMGLASRHIPVGVLPLGTGNDLSRELKWSFIKSAWVFDISVRVKGIGLGSVRG